jgi:hypothetical protein
MWSQEETELMLELEIQLGQLQVPKKMEPYLPGKTNKQIRDKRKDATYRRLLCEQRENNAGNQPEASNRGDMVQSTEPDPSSDQPPVDSNKEVNIAVPSSQTLELLNSTEGKGDSNGEATGNGEQERDSPRATGQATNISHIGRSWDMIIIHQMLESLNDTRGKSGLEPELHEYFTCVMNAARTGNCGSGVC